MRIRLATVALLAVILFALTFPAFASAQTATATSTSSLIVKVVTGLAADQHTALVARNGGTILSSIAPLRLLVVSIPADDLAAARARYQADPQVQTVEQNKVRLSESMPSDTLYANQWALPRIGWDGVFGVVAPASSAKVALLDTGVDASHPDLAGTVVPGTSILDGSDGMTDPSGHGTWLAGIIAAQTNNGLEGIAGVAYAGVQVMPVNVLNANGEGLDSDVIAGVVWAADHGVDVILMAFSNPGFSPNLQDAIDYAWSKGAVIVASAGNNASSEPHFPAGDRGVMGVAATDQGDGQASFSNEGQAVFVAAPGTDIATTEPGGAYTAITGTSAAAAHVAGVAAFMKAVDPALPNGVIVFRIASTADPAGTQVQTGNGRINMARALAATATDSIQPAGAAPVGGGGPFVGPYIADAVNVRSFQSNCSTASGTFTAGSTVCARVTGLGNNASGKVEWFAPGGATATRTTTFSAVNGSFDDKFAPAECGTWTLKAFNPVATLQDMDTFVVTSCNVAPVINRINVSVTVNEGAVASNTGTWSDADAADTVTLSASVGTVIKSGANTAGTWSWSFNTTDGADQSQTVTITANDGNGGIATTTFNLTVTNVPPTVSLSGPMTANQGDTETYNFTVTDPGQDSFAIKATFPRCGTGGTVGAVSTSATGGSFQCTFNSGPASRTVSIQVADSDEADSNVASVSVNVNAPPIVQLLGDTTANEGQTKTYSYTVTDPGDTFTVKSGFPTCGSDGTLGTTSTTPTGGTFQCTFPDGPATTVVSIQVTDSGGLDSNTPMISVTVANVAPAMAITGDAAANEGQTKTYAFTVSDPGVDTFTVKPGSPSCGTGGTLVGGSLTVNAGGGSFQCTFPDGPATPTVGIQVTDSDGADSNIGSIAVTVANVGPTITGITGPVTPVAVGTPVTLTTSFTDPGLDGHACKFDWDDATADTDVNVPETAGTGSCNATHTYFAAGVYTVAVTVSDTDNASVAPSNFEYVVVYDPSAGFVTGGGWLMSPLRAYRPDPTLSGKANFGFVSKYKKGATVPTGETEFQFHAAGFNFHSNTYEYLVIAGAKAQYKGEGTVNGTGRYGFLLTATDGHVRGGGGYDKFRIKIWDKATDEIIYDNMPDGSTTEDIDGVDTQTIGGGSIVIHSGK